MTTTDDDPLIAALGQISENLRETRVSTLQITQAVRDSEERRRRSNLAGGLVGALLLLMMAGVLFGISQIFATQNQIKDCTDPSRPTADCARQGQRRTAEAVRSIVNGQLAASYSVHLCESQAGNATAFRTCIQNNLNAIVEGRLQVPQLPEVPQR